MRDAIRYANAWLAARKVAVALNGGEGGGQGFLPCPSSVRRVGIRNAITIVYGFVTAIHPGIAHSRVGEPLDVTPGRGGVA
jgi:hypothetical protein